MTHTPSDPSKPSGAGVEYTGGDTDRKSPPQIQDKFSSLRKFFIPLIVTGMILVGCVLVIIAGFAIFKFGVFGAKNTPTLTPTFTYTPTFTTKPIMTITPWPTFTFTSSPSATETLTPSIIPSKTPVLSATITLEPTDAFTETFKPAYSKTPTRIKAVCPCSHDIYDCKDFSTHEEAQTCYAYCVYSGWGDAHNLDNDGDGIVCKGLP